jgi:uncharacterized membrane protein
MNQVKRIIHTTLGKALGLCALVLALISTSSITFTHGAGATSQYQSSSSPTISYTPIDYEGATNTAPVAINNHGTVVGFFNKAGITQGFIWKNGNFTTIRYGTNKVTQALGINDRGQIVGLTAPTVADPAVGFLYQNNIITPFVFDGAFDTAAYGINEAGQIVGTYIELLAGNAFKYHGFFGYIGQFKKMDNPNFSNTLLFGVNESAQFVGEGSNNIQLPIFTGFLVNNGGFIPLQFPFADSTSAAGINDCGKIVGEYGTPENDFSHGYFLNDVNNPDDLIKIDIDGAISTKASGINNSGQVVGHFFVQGDDMVSTAHGFLTNIGGGSCPLVITQ